MRGLVALVAALVLVAGAAGVHAGVGVAAERAPTTEEVAIAGSEDRAATIRYTSHGIPHIVASDYEDLGYGYGFAFARENICTAADAYVTARGERSRYFGPNGSYTFQGNGFRFNNLNSDFFFQRIIDRGTIEEMVAEPPPPDGNGPMPQIKRGVRGYVAGYNDYLEETGVGSLPDATCRGKPWVKPISEIDAYRRFYQLALLASGGVAIDGIGSAQPPSNLPLGTADSSQQAASEDPEATARALERGGLDRPAGDLGSNAYGLGKEATANGRGMVLANPHFPWQGSERFYQSHLTIPGELDVSGASLFGVPLILIGHTENMAWSHTVSTAYRFTPFQETLVPGDPTKYLYDGEVREMREDQVTVRAIPPSDGSLPNGCQPGEGDLLTCERTLYSTHHGPVMTSLVGTPLPWTEAEAFTMGDANAANFRYLNHFFETNHAQSVRDLDAVLRRNQGIPWVNTIGADSAGEAYYADLSVVPNVPDQKALTCGTPVGLATFAALRLPVLDGSRSMCEWNEDADAEQKGIFGPSNLPSLFRDDYVTNSNDSHWLSNPEEPLEGFAKIIGDERTPRALRTRSGLVMVLERLAGSDGDPGDRYTLPLLQKAVFANRQYAGELFRDEAVEMCEQQKTLPSSKGEEIDVSEACPVLAEWNLRDDLDSDGAILFREFARNVLKPASVAGTPPSIYDHPFDPNDPVNTPRGLNTEEPRVRAALADAVDELRSKGIRLDAPLGGYQFERRGGEEIPIHGGPGSASVFNAINVGNLTDRGYPDVSHGSSFVMASSFAGPGAACPVEARSILTYSQAATNSASPYFADQTRLFSGKEWVDLPFCEEEILAGPQLAVTELNGGHTERSSNQDGDPGAGDGDSSPPPGTPGGRDRDPREGGEPPRCQGKKATIVGTPRDDRIRGTNRRDVIVAGPGNDVVKARRGNDLVCAGSGKDRVNGGRGSDRIRGGKGRDRLNGGRGRDRLNGGRGRDRLKGGRGKDTLVGGRGNDRCVGGRGSDTLRRCG